MKERERSYGERERKVWVRGGHNSLHVLNKTKAIFNHNSKSRWVENFVLFDYTFKNILFPPLSEQNAGTSSGVSRSRDSVRYYRQSVNATSSYSDIATSFQ